ncbi:MAG: peptide chain release factor N(5)-glutamine methyltransferase [Candidatus Peribacteraceae bacterium]|nr:peptide chain release factor N(5)-glutamine methyltransferase [Candidatus Peribacteraceae bacterium]MDD5074348.1 peptide chain release factor N(5)-glutamine methyltransferase [Candidatus Peribacteraceae bacterium]
MSIGEIIAGGGLDRVESEILAAEALGRERTWILAHPNERITDDDRRRIDAFFRRRKSGEPVCYITGKKEFFARTFHVTPAVLIPRPSTEQLVVSTVRFVRDPCDELREVDANISVLARVFRKNLRPKTIVDCGTGSGCIAVTLALECPGMRVTATDISGEALAIARGNAERNGVAEKIEFLSGSGLQPVQNLWEPFLIVSNPPYVPDNAALDAEVKEFEPASALFGGPDGTDILRSIYAQALNHPFCAGILLECQSDQIEKILA